MPRLTTASALRKNIFEKTIETIGRSTVPTSMASTTQFPVASEEDLGGSQQADGSITLATFDELDQRSQKRAAKNAPAGGLGAQFEQSFGQKGACGSS